MLWKRGPGRPVGAAFPRGMAYKRMQRAAAIKCPSAHKYKSYGIVLLFLDAPGGRDPEKQLSAQWPSQCPQIWSRAREPNLAGIAYSSPRRVLQV